MDHHLAFMSNMFHDDTKNLEDRDNNEAEDPDCNQPTVSVTTMALNVAHAVVTPSSSTATGTTTDNTKNSKNKKNAKDSATMADRMETSPTEQTVQVDTREPATEGGEVKETINGPRMSFDDFMESSLNSKGKVKNRRKSFFTPGRSRARSRPRSTPRDRRRNSMGGNESTKNKSTGNDNNNDKNDNDNNDKNEMTLEEYVQKSSRVQSFLGNAWQHVKHATSHKDGEKNSTVAASPATNGSKKKKKKRLRGNNDKDSIRSEVIQESDKNKIEYTLATERDGEGVAGLPRGMVREQTTEIWRLKRQLEQVKQENLALKETHDSIQQELCTSQNRNQRVQTELRVAHEKARAARAEADAAETTATHMAQQLNDLQTIVEETKKAAALLQDEQELVEKKVARAESALQHKSMELTRARETMSKHEAQQELFKVSQQAWEREYDALQDQLTKASNELEVLERQKNESQAMAEARLERFQKLQQEWTEVQALLEEATQSKLDAHQTVMQLSETVSELQKANSDMHRHLQTTQSSSHEQALQQQGAIEKAERNGLNLQIQKEELEDEISRLQVRNKKQQSVKEESRRFSLPPLSKNKTTEAVTQSTTPTAHDVVTQKNRFSLPPLGPAKSQNENAENSLNKCEKCAICNGPGYGVMRRCQCGLKTCEARAHMTCANGFPKSISVSHPGTPAPRLPTVFCQEATTYSVQKKEPLKEQAPTETETTA